MNYPHLHSSDIVLWLRWTARIWSVMSVVLLFLFFIGEGIQPAKITPKEWVGLLFFPVGVVIGLMIAWRREGLGGLITVSSLAAFYFIYEWLLSGSFPKGWAFLMFAAPGFIYLLVWWLARHVKNVAMP
ncbi:MAG: hypothetical protein AB1757_29595 [Acidobacteriota bacterium]